MSKIYIVTNRTQTGNRHLVSLLQEAAAGGIDAIILREKDMNPGDLYKLACRIKDICTATDTALFINTSIEVALACDADGVHLGHGSLPLDAARRLLPGKKVGVSIHSLEEALEAQNKGADYLLAGHVFPTASKPDRPERGTGFINQVSSHTSVPVIAIGGINHSNAGSVIRAGADGIAVMSLAMHAPDVRETIRKLRLSLSRQN